MSESGTISSSADRRHRLGEVVTWGIGLVLIFGVAPLVRSRVSLSDELDFYSLVLPMWTLLQLALFAGVLAWMRPRAAVWHAPVRGVVALACAVLLGVLQPVILTSLSTVAGGAAAPLAGDPLQVALVWSTPLLFYVVPAVIVAAPWVGSATLRVVRVLGIATVVLGAFDIVAIYWFSHLWALYVR